MKKYAKISYLVVLIFCMMVNVLLANASTTGTVIADGNLYVRSSIDGSSIGKLANGTVVTVTNTDAGSNAKCKNWYKINYDNGKSGYACGDYIELLKGYASCVENRDPLNVWKDVNKSGKVASVSCDKELSILDKDISSNSKCKNNWYKVKYGNSVGYACSTYVYTSKKVSVSTTYDRPWTTPKKAITGGAEFIAQNYISKGQHTSYLKKFNVNPASSNKIYNHQYMANLRAPSSEALTSYNSYKENNLLSLPLHFVIPTYNEMPDVTILPGSIIDNTGQSEVTDSAFEEKLNNQGFSETYKKKLRLIHNSHPNWTFENLKTGLKFANAVNAEQAVSSINGRTDYYYKAANGAYVETEPGWYLASTATVSYYLDPRNFLTEQGILMFESLKFSENYTESVIQSVLNNTFMQQNSVKDNQSYASIFYEAGKAKDISSVYLASLARQESGNNGSIATTGEEFSYKNVTYKNLYNFFNIGAYSSEESPIKAGLVWASGGSDCVVVGSSCMPDDSSKEPSNENPGNNGNNSEETTPTTSTTPSQEPSKTPEEDQKPQPPTNKGSNYYTEKLGVTNKQGYINGIVPGTTASTIASRLQDASNVSIRNALGQGITGNTRVGTGSTITVTDKDNKTTYTYTLVIYGDVNGDGRITASDYVCIKNYIMGKISLSDASKKGADSNKNNSITASDYVVIKNYILGRTTISQS